MGFFALIYVIISLTSIISCLNYYEKFGIKENASKVEIKQAFRNLARVHHTDKGGENDKMVELNEIYQTLIDDSKRRMYDLTHGISTIAIETRFHQYDFTLADFAGRNPEVTFKLDGVGEFTMFRTPDLLLGKKKYLKHPTESIITDVISFRLVQGNQIRDDPLLSKMTLVKGTVSDILYEATISKDGWIQLPTEWCSKNNGRFKDCRVNVNELDGTVKCPNSNSTRQCLKFTGSGMFYFQLDPIIGWRQGDMYIPLNEGKKS